MPSDQTKVEKDEIGSVFENKRRSGKIIQCRILDRSQIPPMGGECGPSA